MTEYPGNNNIREVEADMGAELSAETESRAGEDEHTAVQCNGGS